MSGSQFGVLLCVTGGNYLIQIDMARRKYSDKEKAFYLLALQANSGNLLRTVKETGVPIATLSRWRDGEGLSDDVSEIGKEKAPDLADKFEALAHKLVDAAPGFITRDNTTLGMLATAAGIATDKARLLRGESTTNSRVEYVEIAEQRTAKVLDMTHRLRKVS